MSLKMREIGTMMDDIKGLSAIYREIKITMTQQKNCSRDTRISGINMRKTAGI